MKSWEKEIFKKLKINLIDTEKENFDKIQK